MKFEDVRSARGRLADMGNPRPDDRSYSEYAHLKRMLAVNDVCCEQCGRAGTVVGRACYECVALCGYDGCGEAADPNELGSMCPKHLGEFIAAGKDL